MIDTLHVSLMRADGGGPAYVADLVAAQRDEGLSVAAAVPAGGYIVSLLPSGVPLVLLSSSFGPLGLLHSALALRRAIRDWQPRVLHVHSAYAGGVGRVLVGTLRWCDRPCVVFQPHAWSWFRFRNRPMRVAAKLVERLLQKWTDVYVCGSQDEADTGRAAGLQVGMVVIENAVDTDRYRPIVQAERARRKVELGFEATTPVAVCVARLVPQKAHHVLLQAWRYVVAACPDAQLILVGDGSRSRELQALRTPNVMWTGSRRDPEWFHQLADVGVLSSEYESLALSLLEAMACGNPVAVTASEGATQAVSGGELPPAGDVVPIGATEQLADAIVKWLRAAGTPEAEHTRTAARARAIDRYDVARWREQMAVLYENLLGVKPSIVGSRAAAAAEMPGQAIA